MLRRRVFSSSLGFVILLVSLSSFVVMNVMAVPIEQTIASRYSVGSWNGNGVPSSLLMDVLRNSYGYIGNHRSVPRVSSDYSLALFVANASGTYRYVPEENLLVIHDGSVNEQTLAPRFQQSAYPDGATALVIIVWNQSKVSNQYYAWLESGLVVQNMYLAAISLNLGTHCIALIDANGLRSDLKLPTTMTPFIIMPIGYPASGYGTVSPDTGRMTGNLPRTQLSQTAFADAINQLLYAQVWSQDSLSLQEQSQLLWAGYGYSSTGHRTVPSAGSVYPIRIWVLNSTGAFEYSPETHSVAAKLQGDKRTEVAAVFGSQSWASNAATIFLVVYDSNKAGNYGHTEWFELEAGLVTQNILLEATAYNLSGNIVSQGLENWNGAGAASIRNVLGMSSSLVPLCAIPVGHDGEIPEFSNLLVTTLLLVTASGVTAYVVFVRRKRLQPEKMG